MTNFTRRQFVAATLAGGLISQIPFSSRLFRPIGANDDIRLGFISCGGRANQLMNQFAGLEGVRIAGLCDPDSDRLGRARERYPTAESWSDLRDLIASPNIDAVVVATCNHWHCLAAIWAMQAGKDVYVEKPLSHSQWEGVQTVAAARSLNRVCQLGTQQRSDPMQAQIKKFLHEDKALGEIQVARVNRYGIRGPIGKRETPLSISDKIDYDLWLGPAADQPIFRDNLQYDWHWDWNTGSGEMGNWGVHVLDDVRNVVFLDSVGLPQRIAGGGGRVVWNDAGQTPNVHWAWFDTGSYPVMIGLSNLPDEPDSKKAARHHGPDSGYVVYCQGGEFHGQRSRGVAFDKDGKEIKRFSGNSGDGLHQQNFIDSVRQQDSSLLNAEIETGNHSTGWCNLANIAFRAGVSIDADPASAVALPQWQALMHDLAGHLGVYGLTTRDTALVASPILTLDQETGEFVGDNSLVANKLLRREYRKGFEVPDLMANQLK